MVQVKAEEAGSTSIYEQDYVRWIEQQVELLHEGSLESLDVPNLIDELGDLAINHKHALESNLVVVLKHLLKYHYQPDRRSRSWLSSIREHRRRIRRIILGSPSLRPYAATVFADAYAEGRLQAADETALPAEGFLAAAPWTLEQVLDPDFLPD